MNIRVIGPSHRFSEKMKNLFSVTYSIAQNSAYQASHCCNTLLIGCVNLFERLYIFWICRIAQSLYCICHSCYQNVYLNGIRAWVIDEKAHSMFKDWIHITNYCVCKLNDIGNLHFNLWPELNLGFLIASSSVEHGTLGGVSTSTFWRLHMRWFFLILETYQTRFENHWIRKLSLKFTP